MNEQLDPQVVNLAKAIRQTESNGNFQAKGASGEYGAYQFTEPTWNKQAAQFGVRTPLSQATPEEQNKVAYHQLKQWKDQGYNVGQIASMWNAGEGKKDAYLTGHEGWNNSGVHYDTAAYAKSVATAYQTIKNGGQVGLDPANPSAVGNNFIAPPSSTTSGSDFIKAPPPPQPVPMAGPYALPEDPSQPSSQPKSLGGFLGNAVSSVWDVAKGLGHVVQHPLETAGNLADLGAGALETGVFKATDPNYATKAKTPEMQKFGNAVDFYKNRYGGVQNIKDTLYKDPAGAALDASAILGGGELALGKLGKISELSKAAELTKLFPGVDTATEAANAVRGTSGFSKAAAGVGKVAGYVDPIRVAGKGVGLLGKAAENSGMYGLAKLTGKEPSSLRTVVENPEAFSPGNVGNLTRASLGEEIGSALKARSTALSDTGAGYQGVRESGVAAKVAPDMLGNLIADNTGLVVKDGKLISGPDASIRASKDVRALQEVYDRYQPLFDRGEMTANQYLNMREDLSNAANFEREFSKSRPVEGAAAAIRGKANEAIRPQLTGLEELDAKFAPQIQEYNQLKQGFLTKDGELSDAAINRIANATGKGKDKMLARLEQISPGITKKIEIVKAVEDIQNMHKVGTYTRSLIEGGGLVAGLTTANIPLIAGSLASIFLTQPAIVVKLLRLYGSAKLNAAVLEQIGAAAKGVGTGLIGAQRLNSAVR